MKRIICFFLGHNWGPKIPWSTYTIEVPFDGDFMVHTCKRCKFSTEVRS